MARTATNTVVLLETNEADGIRPVYERNAADGNILPGHALVLTSSGTVDGAGAAASGPWLVAIENQYVSGNLSAGANLSTAFTSGEPVPYIYAQPGDLVYMLVGASQTIAVGDALETEAGGGLVALAAGTRVGIAESAATTGVGETARVKVRIG